jgi:hypothetical protein
MISQWSHWANDGAGGRKPVAAVGDSPSMAKTFTTPKEHWGKVTSRPQRSRSELEAIAYQLGWTVENVKRAIALGVL